MQAVIQAISNASIFTGEELLENHALVIEDCLISRLLPRDQLPVDLATTHDLDGGRVVPRSLRQAFSEPGGPAC